MKGSFATKWSRYYETRVSDPVCCWFWYRFGVENSLNHALVPLRGQNSRRASRTFSYGNLISPFCPMNADSKSQVRKMHNSRSFSIAQSSGEHSNSTTSAWWSRWRDRPDIRWPLRVWVSLISQFYLTFLACECMTRRTVHVVPLVFTSSSQRVDAVLVSAEVVGLPFGPGSKTGIPIDPAVFPFGLHVA